MKEKKNIERLFQEKFKDFEVQPPENSWNEIQRKLHPEKEKKKRILPFWLRLSGIASAILIGFLVFKNDNGNLNDNMNVNNNSNGSGNLNLNDGSDNYPNNDNNINSTEVVIQSTDSEAEQTENKPVYRTEKNKKVIEETVYSVAHSQKNKLSENQSDFVVSAKTENLVEEKHTESQRSNSSDYGKEELFVTADDESNQEKKDLLEEIKLAQQENDENDDDDQIKSFNKWKITPNVAPVVMNSFSSGSPISDKFAGNSKDFQTSASYGLGLDYALTQKLSIRTGINKLSTGYNTNDIVVYASANHIEMLENSVNVNFRGENKNIVIAPQSSVTGLFDSDIASGFNSEMKASEMGYINQKMGYIEVPLELSYKLLDSRFGIEIIGGMSTLFLQENEVYVITDGMKTAVGQANNLNDVHFSTNLGIGFRYEIFKSFDINIDPMFKYQLGTFDKNSGNFKPYILGVYTGLSFKF